MTKAALYDPTQPRDDRGRWSSEDSLGDAIGDRSDTRAVNKRLAKIAKGPVMHEGNQDYFLNNSDTEPKLFNTKDLIREPMQQNKCHANVSHCWKAKKIDAFATGYGYVKLKSGNGLWLPHSWGMRNGKIVETTPASFDMYYGVELAKYMADTMADVQLR